MSTPKETVPQPGKSEIEGSGAPPDSGSDGPPINDSTTGERCFIPKKDQAAEQVTSAADVGTKETSQTEDISDSDRTTDTDGHNARTSTRAFSSLNAKFYAISRSEHNELVVKASKSAPVPMDPKAVEFLGRLSFADSHVADPLVVVDANRRGRYAYELLSYGRTGLELGDIETASTALNWFERRVADVEGPGIRRKYLLSTLAVAAKIGVPCAFLGLVMRHVMPLVSTDWIFEAKLFQVALFLAAGNSLGIIFFAFLRNLDLRFDQLAKFDPANLDPMLRFALVWVITVIFGIFLTPKILVVALGSRELNGFIDDSLMAVIIGVLCGYSDGLVSRLLAGVLRNPQSRDSEKTQS